MNIKIECKIFIHRSYDYKKGWNYWFNSLNKIAKMNSGHEFIHIDKISYVAKLLKSYCCKCFNLR